MRRERPGLSPVASSNVEADTHLVGCASTALFTPINIDPQGRDEPATTHSPNKRRKTSREGGFCLGNWRGALEAQDVSSLDVPADVAGQEHAERRSAGAVPSPGQHDVATVSPRDSPRDEVVSNLSAPHGLSPHGVGNTTSPLHPDLPLGGETGSLGRTEQTEGGRRAQVPTSSPLHRLSPPAPQLKRYPPAGNMEDPLGLDGLTGTVDPASIHLNAGNGQQEGPGAATRGSGDGAEGTAGQGEGLTEFDLAAPRVASLDNNDFVGYSADQNEFVDGNGNNQHFDDVLLDTAWLDLMSSGSVL